MIEVTWTFLLITIVTSIIGCSIGMIVFWLVLGKDEFYGYGIGEAVTRVMWFAIGQLVLLFALGISNIFIQ